MPIKGSVVFGDDDSAQTTAFSTSSDQGRLIQVDSYTSGTSTWTKPAGCNTVHVLVCGAGGGAAGYCESGGAGGYVEEIIDVSSVSSVTVTVGGGGGAVGYYAAGGRGGTSSFGSYCTATGGYGANANYSHTAGVGGSGSGGNLNLQGGSGTGHGNTSGREAVGHGGRSKFGGTRISSHSTNNGNLSNAAPGAGGQGGAMQGWAGGNGYNGIVVVYSYS